MDIRDKDGLTESEFLAQYRPGDYPHPSLTVDIVLFASDSRDDSDRVRVLLIQRGGHPCLGSWALPGGFVEPKEDVETAVARELAEETGITGIACEQLGVYSAPGRDPRGWTVSAAFIASLDQLPIAQAGDDAADALWCPIRVRKHDDGTYKMQVEAGDKLLHCQFEERAARFMPARAQVLSAHGFAFDHAQIVADAWLATHK
ncbi:MAG: NUDIX hydrolase [Coriobacteriales bacterium]|nr:NUDIX hydrolase [Coriobacteriales bacterium]